MNRLAMEFVEIMRRGRARDEGKREGMGLALFMNRVGMAFVEVMRRAHPRDEGGTEGRVGDSYFIINSFKSTTI